MATVKTAFKAVAPGEIYPREYLPGDQVDGWLADVAREMGALEAESPARAAKAKARG